MKVAVTDDSFAFEVVRNLGFMYYGGSDLGGRFAGPMPSRRLVS
jgi:hypothetical protein